ncbi:uncharacterized protein LOC111050623 isoform X1 [Nilaparvata lugens]|uniref:uncharacterized protein LOC111050623 isoform X1 n=2 Tax=Nilaparvata lugens TaxID=108931 RepID=UPI00193EBA2D|nr:uncharacterized protein LOC111050623 isoform X1 [Nilaparvata lugens]
MTQSNFQQTYVIPLRILYFNFIIQLKYSVFHFFKGDIKASCADKTSEGRTITSIMGKLVTLDVAVNFSWRGVQRKDHKIEKKPFKDLLIAKVMIAATKRCWPESELKQVQLKAATWLAQAQSKLDKMNQPTPATTDQLIDIDCEDELVK